MPPGDVDKGDVALHIFFVLDKIDFTKSGVPPARQGVPRESTHHIVHSGQRYVIAILAHIGHILLQLLQFRLYGSPLAFHGQGEHLVGRVAYGGTGTRWLWGRKEIGVLLVAITRAIILGIRVGFARRRGTFAARGRIIWRPRQR